MSASAEVVLNCAVPPVLWSEKDSPHSLRIDRISLTDAAGKLRIAVSSSCVSAAISPIFRIPARIRALYAGGDRANRPIEVSAEKQLFIMEKTSLTSKCSGSTSFLLH